MTPPDDNEIDLLAGYALGSLTPEEIAQVGRLLDRRPELRATLAELRETADQLPAALPEVEPPADLRRRTLDHAVGRAPATHSAPPAARGLASMRRWLAAIGALAAAAAVIAAVLWGQLGSARSELARVQGQLAALQATQEELLAVIARPDALVRLTGPGGSGAVARGEDGSLALAARLPELESGRVYQLWLIQGDGPPESGGTFTVDAEGYGALSVPPGQSARAADTFAVTNEPAPGSPGPTTPILISGVTAA